MGGELTLKIRSEFQLKHERMDVSALPFLSLVADPSREWATVAGHDYGVTKCMQNVQSNVQLFVLSLCDSN
jgi:hypothetical protein